MKILLVGELSGFHNNLKAGLVELGHEVTIAGGGDGWKRFPVDVDFSVNNEKLLNKLYRNLKPLLNLKKLGGYDIVQFATPLLFNPRINYLYYFLLHKINRGNSFLCGISSNDPYYLEATKHFKYSPYNDFDITFKERYFPKFSRHDLLAHKKIISFVKSVIPSCYDYQYGYKLNKYSKLNNIIPFPFDLRNETFIGNKTSKKIKLFHGISRGKNKGSDYIISALNKAKAKYPTDVEVKIVEKIPFAQYINLVNDANVLFDQCLSYSYGYNALIGLAKGKVVLSGAEKVAMDALGVGSNCPVINIIPDENQIFQKIKDLIERKNTIEELGEEGRKFIEKHHSANLVANSYLKAWGINH